MSGDDINKIVIVGAGLTGSFSAYFLARRGGASVVLIDPDLEAGCASYNNPGGINPLHGPGIPGAMSGFALRCYRMHLREWPLVRDLSGIDFNGRLVVRLFPALVESDVARLHEAARLYLEAPEFSARWLDPGELRKVDARLSDQVLGGLVTTGNATVDSAKYVRAIRRAARALGVEFVKGRVTAMEKESDSATAVIAGSRRFTCSEVLFATGPWLELIADCFGAAAPVEPVRGQLLLVELGPEAHKHDITWRQYGIYHAHDRFFWLGGTREHAGFDPAPSSQGQREIMDGVSKLIPGINGARIVRKAAGLRPATPDGMPIVGRVPGYRNVHVASGGGQKGVLLSIGLARTVADAIAGDGDGDDIAWISPDRLIGASAAQRASV